MQQTQQSQQHQQLMRSVVTSLSDTESDDGVVVTENVPHLDSKSHLPIVLPWVGCLVWPLLLTVPLLLGGIPGYASTTSFYSIIFPESWYQYNVQNPNPKPLGLILGILAVVVGQIFLLCYFYLHKFKYLGPITSVQSKGPPNYEWSEGLFTHLAQPEGFVMLTLYLSVTWMCHLMPSSYYSFEGTIQWKETIACLIVQDGFQFFMHHVEHKVSRWFYRNSHKPHHKFTNPRLFDAFNGSILDTLCMILIPLYATAMSVRTANVWTYMAFGSLYANWLTMIHSEYAFPWDGLFRTLGMGTPGDHHVHHKFFKYNFGHLFMWFDQLCGTYKGPQQFSKLAFNRNV